MRQNKEINERLTETFTMVASARYLNLLVNLKSSQALRASWYEEIRSYASDFPGVAQWIRIHQPRQGTQVWSLVGDIPHAAEQLSPLCHNYRTRALEPTRCNQSPCVLQLRKPSRSWARALQQEKPPQQEACATQWEAASPPATRENPLTVTKIQRSQK